MQFNGQFYGVESFHRPSAAAIGKGMDPAKIQQAILYTKDYFMKHNGYYRGTISLIAGLPHETEETLNETLNWCIENWKTNHLAVTPLIIASDHNNVKQSTLSASYEKQGYSLADNEQILLEESHPDLTRIYQSNSIVPELKYYLKTFVRNLSPTILLHRWKSNTGMTERDALLWIANNVWGADEYLDFGVDHCRMDEWYVAGKTDQDMLGSYRDLGGMRPPLQVKVDFIEKYKQQKLDVAQ
jgi:radical SAM superfamily enzyme